MTDVYDINGNMMHENRASYMIHNYIHIDEDTQQMVGGSSTASKPPLT